MRKGIPRPLEAFLAAAGLVLASPMLFLSACAIKSTSRGPVLFLQERVGMGGRTFVLHKFRTMRLEESGPQITARGDSRITGAGRWLRMLKFDELPELWNVLRGDMSFVGPRPEVPRYVDMANPVWREVLAVRPGLTDPVTIRLRNEEDMLAGVEGDRERYYRDVLQPWKLLGYVEYLRRRTGWTDLRVLLDTLIVVLFPAKRLSVDPTRL